jgi:hypothetical protein
LCPEPENESKLATAQKEQTGRRLPPLAKDNRHGVVLDGMLWNDDSGEISEYALILALILMLGIALISQTGTTLKRLYQRISSDQAISATTAPKN